MATLALVEGGAFIGREGVGTLSSLFSKRGSGDSKQSCTWREKERAGRKGGEGEWRRKEEWRAQKEERERQAHSSLKFKKERGKRNG